MDPVYVEYSGLEEAKAAERALNSGELASQSGGVQVARFATELHQLPFAGNDVPCRTLYLGRVPSKVLLFKRSLLQLFETYGPVLDLRIRKQPPSVLTGHATHLPAAMEDGWPKGSCYIEYNILNDGVAACEDLGTKNQLMFYGKPLYVAYASPRSSEVVSFQRALFDPMVDH
jgi:RNA recognition motif-containing protein